jgi:hypothetical protein
MSCCSTEAPGRRKSRCGRGQNRSDIGLTCVLLPQGRARSRCRSISAGKRLKILKS